MSRVLMIGLILALSQPVAAEVTVASGPSALIYGKSEITIKTRSQGEIVTLGVAEGQKVKRGEMVAQLDDRQEKIDQAQAESEYVLAKDDWKKTEKLKKYVSADEINQKRSSYLKKKSVFDLKSLDIEKKKITSPIDGIVTRLYFEKGETVSVGDKFVEIVQMEDLYLVANVPSAEVSAYKVGTEFRFKVDGQPATFDAKVIFSSPIIDASSDTVRIKFEAKNVRLGDAPDGAFALKPGMVATLLKK